MGGYIILLSLEKVLVNQGLIVKCIPFYQHYKYKMSSVNFFPSYVKFVAALTREKKIVSIHHSPASGEKLRTLALALSTYYVSIQYPATSAVNILSACDYFNSQPEAA